MGEFWKNASLKGLIDSLKTSIEYDRHLNTIRRIGPSELQLWGLAMLVGIVLGALAYYFVEAFLWLTRFFYQSDSNNLLYYTTALPNWWIVAIPTLGGLLTGLVLWKFTDDARARSIADVIEDAALNGGRTDRKTGLASAAGNFISLAMGGSGGQEGPLVHFGATLTSQIAKYFKLSGEHSRELMGCAAAAVIGAVFNAPLAGVVFANEIILRHYSISSFTPLAIASVMGTIVGHLLSGGNFAQIEFLAISVSSYSEIFAFLLLGLICGLVAYIYIQSIFVLEDLIKNTAGRWNYWPPLRPMIAGLALGTIALSFPEIIGVGYQTTTQALMGNIGFYEIFTIISIKIIAVAITISGRMGGGVFSGSMMVGALSGLAFGTVALALVDSEGMAFLHRFVGEGFEGVVQLYALAGMAAVSAAVLGAPLSTTLIVLEMTRDWNAGIVVMAAVSVAVGISRYLVDKSFFLTQLERRDIHISAGPQVYLQSMLKVRAHMTIDPLSPEEVVDLRAKNALVFDGDNFEDALSRFEKSGSSRLLVLENQRSEDPSLNAVIGYLDYVVALRAYSQALGDLTAEEHN